MIERKWVIIIISIMVLSCIDALFTFNLISMGIAEEANPIMAGALGLGLVPFLLIKFSITGGCLLVLLAYRSVKLFNLIAVHYVLYVLLIMYILLILYELSLFALPLWYGGV